MMKWWHRWRIVRLEARAVLIKAEAEARCVGDPGAWGLPMRGWASDSYRVAYSKVQGKIARHRCLLGWKVARAIATTDVVV